MTAMKYCTLNTHSLIEEDYEEKLKIFVEDILKEEPDIIAMQEVNQRIDDEDADVCELQGYVGDPGIIKNSNHALRVANLLRERGHSYEWYWVPSKVGYDCYDEGLALFSRLPIEETEQFYISATQEYSDWRARKAIGIKVNDQGKERWFYTVHMGWWDDEAEPFLKQWETLNRYVSAHQDEHCTLLGDFNAPDNRRGESYDTILAQGWYDLYHTAIRKEGSYTVLEQIDGWCEGTSAMRIDYAFSNQPQEVSAYRILWDGTTRPRISDHFGILIEEREK